MRLKVYLRGLIFPNRCPFCDRLIKENLTVCGSCKPKLPGFSIETYAIGAVLCSSPFKYDGMFAAAIKRFKFKKRRNYTESLGFYISSSVLKIFTAGQLESIDYISCVPMYGKGGTKTANHAELLGKEVAKQLGIEYAETLVKIKPNKKQHTLKQSERFKNVKGVFKCSDRELVKGKNILIVDDIITTGATLGECARALKKAGSGKIYCAVFASDSI